MADKLTQQILDALARAAADPAGSPLFASKAESGLFPATAKPAAHKCLADGLLKPIADPRAKPGREPHVLTDAGWGFLLEAANPKQVLEDFVRVLEARQGEVDDLLAVAQRMAESLIGLREAVARVLPKITAGRVAEATPPPPTDLAALILARLSDWDSTAGEDCTLPELFRRLGAPSIGTFHDALRQLHDRGAIYLHPWTGPLYAVPEPAFALLVGHGVAYYASARTETAVPRSSPQVRPDRLAAV